MSKSYEDLGFSSQNMPILSKASLLTQEEIDRYWRDRYLLKRGLVVGKKLEIVKAFLWTNLVSSKLYEKVAMQTWKFNKNIAKFALESNAVSITAQLLQEKRSVRILLKDAIFAQASTKQGCGFHVDDLGIWPANSTGVTFWVALKPMHAAESEGICLAKGSHIASDWI